MKHPETHCDCPFIGYPIGAQMALSCLWQDRNHEGDDIGNGL